jgi:hypothetical protein
LGWDEKMKMDIHLTLDAEQLQAWEQIKAAYYKKDLTPPSMSVAMRVKFNEVIYVELAKLKDKKALAELRKHEKMLIRRKRMGDILRDAGWQEYTTGKMARLIAMRGEKHPSVAEFRQLMFEEGRSRGLRGPVKRLARRKKAAVTKL